MKKSKKIENINKESKSKKNKALKILSLILAIIIVIITSIFIYSMLFTNKTKNNTITAVKTITTEYGQNQEVKYTIKIKDYKLESAVKEITFQTEEEANLEYNRYQIINEYEVREIGLELNNKKLILTMPEKQFKLDINYKNRSNLIYEGEEDEQINQEELKQCLIDQDYQIK